MYDIKVYQGNLWGTIKESDQAIVNKRTVEEEIDAAEEMEYRICID